MKTKNEVNLPTADFYRAVVRNEYNRLKGELEQKSDEAQPNHEEKLCRFLNALGIHDIHSDNRHAA